jgi:hypothetical protein
VPSLGESSWKRLGSFLEEGVVMRFPILFAVAFSSCILVACGGDENTASSSAAAASASPENDCGDVVYGNGPAWCPADREAKFDCFLEAKRSCTSARLGITYTSDEGELTINELVVDGACNVILRSDNTRDAWAAKPGVTTTTKTCVSRIHAGDTCTTLRVDRCP